jgi:dipeptidyl aminopeptidase/acylaminoacyl peptidase
MRQLLKFLLVLALCYSTNAAGSFSIDQVMSAPFASELTASPKGERAAWVENEQGRRNIYVASAPDWSAKKITGFDQDDGQEIDELAWSPQGDYLLFVRGGDFENGGENPNPASELKRPSQDVWRVAFDGKPAVKLFEGKSPKISSQNKIIFLRGNQVFQVNDLQEGTGAYSTSLQTSVLIEQKGKQSDLTWAPDGQSFAFVSRRQDHSFIAVYNLADESLRYLDPNVDSDQTPVWSPDGRSLAFLRIPATAREAFFSARRTGQPWSIRIADPKTGAGHELFRASDGPGSVFHDIVADNQIFWTAADQIVFPWERTGWLHLYSLPAAGGAPRELTPGAGEVEHVALSPDAKTIYYSTNIGNIDRRHLSSVSLANDSNPKPITSGEAIEWAPQVASDDRTLLYLASSYNERSHAAVRSAGGESKSLGPNPPANFPKTALVKPQPVMITAADGLQIHGQLFLPADHASRVRHPALIFFHGGSRRQMLLGFHYMYYYSNAYSLNEYLASQGYVVLSVNYRSGIGYGLDFREAIHYGAAGGSEYNDVVGAGLFLKSRSDVDPARVGVWGGSYGGYLTALALARSSDMFAAGVDFHGVHDWSTLRGYLTGGLIGGDPHDLEERQDAARMAFDSSPMASVDTWRSPVLLIHGDDDRNVEFSQTVTLVEALRKRHVEFQELIFPNEIHDFLLQRDWVTAYRATADFFSRKLQHGSSAESGVSSAAVTPRQN